MDAPRLRARVYSRARRRARGCPLVPLRRGHFESNRDRMRRGARNPLRPTGVFCQALIALFRLREREWPKMRARLGLNLAAAVAGAGTALTAATVLTALSIAPA